MNNVYQACLLDKIKDQKLQLELVNCLMGSIDAKKKTGECMAKLKGNSEFNNSFYFRYNMYRIFPSIIRRYHILVPDVIFYISFNFFHKSGTKTLIV